MPITVFRHRGPFDHSTRQIRALKYFEDYLTEMTSDFTLPYPNTKYFNPSCIFHDNGTITRSADGIKSMMQRVFGQFDKAIFKPRYLQVLDESGVEKGRYTIIAELLVRYWFKGDEEPVEAPRLMVIEIGKGGTEEAYQGLAYDEVWLGWNVGILKEEKERRAKILDEK